MESLVNGNILTTLTGEKKDTRRDKRLQRGAKGKQFFQVPLSKDSKSCHHEPTLECSLFPLHHMLKFYPLGHSSMANFIPSLNMQVSFSADIHSPLFLVFWLDSKQVKFTDYSIVSTDKRNGR